MSLRDAGRTIAVLLAGAALAGCDGEALQTSEEGDGSIPCPGGSICPEDTYGVAVPLSLTAVTADRGRQIVCVINDPRRPKVCPPGMEGRLWTKAPHQVSCYPGINNPQCPSGDYYAFLCREGENAKCPGIATTKSAASPGRKGEGGAEPTDEARPN